MAAIALALGLVFSDVGLHLEDVAGLSIEDAMALAERLGEALAPRAGGRYVLDDPLWPECSGPGRCISEVQLRTKADEVVYVRLYAGPTRIRLIAERVTGPKRLPVEDDLPRQGSPADARWDRMAVRLFPEPLSSSAPSLGPQLVPAPASPDGRAFGPWPYVTAGTGVVAVAVAGAFGVSSRSARSRIESEPLSNAAFERELSRMTDHGNVANVLFAVGGTLMVTGVVLWLLD